MIPAWIVTRRAEARGPPRSSPRAVAAPVARAGTISRNPSAPIVSAIPEEPDPPDDVLLCQWDRPRRRRSFDRRRGNAGHRTSTRPRRRASRRRRRPAHGVRTELQRRAPRADARFPSTRAGAGEVAGPTPFEHAKSSREDLHVLVEAQAGSTTGRLQLGCGTCGVVERSVAWAEATAGNASAASATRASAPHRCCYPGERRQMAEDRRDVAVGEEHGPTTTTITAAKPDSQGDRARSERRAQAATSAPTRNVQPSRWCRKAERAKNQGFCSWTMNGDPR